MHCLAPDSDGDGTGCDNMTCIITTFNPFRKCELKLNTSALLASEKNSLKRSLVESNSGATQEEEAKSKSPESNTVVKKLKSDEI